MRCCSHPVFNQELHMSRAQGMHSGSECNPLHVGRTQSNPLPGCPCAQVASLKVDEAVLNVTAPAAAATEGPDRPPESNLLTSLLSSASSKATAQEAVGSGSGSASTLRQAGLGAARASCSGLYPSKWQKATQQLVAEAEQTVADSSR